MIALDSPKWSSLSHAYGTASDIPGLLRQLEHYPPQTDYKDEPYFSLWSSLCHQGDVYTASYAAVPHILSLASHAPERITFDYLLLPTSIEIARGKGRGPAVPLELAENYHNAFQTIPAIIGEIKAARLNELWTRTCAGALAVVGGHFDLADAFLEMNNISAKQFLDWLQTN